VSDIATPATPIPSSTATRAAAVTVFPIILAVSLCHMINDIMQSLLAAIYPLLKTNFQLDYWQIGMLTLAFQVTASLLQPLVGIYTDKRPLPYSLTVGMGSSAIGLIVLAFAPTYGLLVLGACFIGIGSSIFHPESSRVARLASGGRFGLAQSLFQVGGNFGQSLGPLLAAFIVVPFGQGSVGWFALGAIAGMVILWKVGTWYGNHVRNAVKRTAASTALTLPRRTVTIALIVLVILTFSKNVYMASISSYYTFYVIERFDVGVQQSQYLLFVFLGAAALGTILGGPVGDRFGAKFVIWLSILGVLPFTLILPYANLEWTVILSFVIGLLMASAFPAIVVMAQELVPGRVGMVAGIFFGFAFGMGGVAAAVLGVVADHKGIEYVYGVCAFLPLLGLLTVFLPSKTALKG
jgi:FSR family fosmidomycin resistance protein-like MFS transporter